ncbi:hypothetical protein NUW58_g132 [Xylaria curta]|uniref:Uncharacterized protein n=1 Tax=Xylaria curta TaxID=42375 RepID=A0ACC1PSW5_9PEZI|nr:hypothetical protein NUW58_g132 [Xylaria curta]
MPLSTITETGRRGWGVLGYRIVRFRGRYYTPRRYMRYMHLSDMTGAVFESIPADPNEYQQWLGSMRAEYAAKESALETHVHTIRDGVKPDSSQYEEFETIPSELPQINERFVREPRFYIINLDQEILTLEWGIHWKLGNLPRSKCLYNRDFSVIMYPCDYIIRLDMCPEEYLASPALELPKPNWAIEHDFRRVTPKTDLVEARKAFLTCILV